MITSAVRTYSAIWILAICGVALPALGQAPQEREQASSEAPGGTGLDVQVPTEGPPSVLPPPATPDGVPAGVDSTAQVRPADPSGTEAPASTPGVSAPEKSPAPSGAPIIGGLKKVLNMLGGDAQLQPVEAGEKTATGQQPEATDKAATDENQRKINELVRLANSNIEKGRVAEAMRNVNDLITLKPYEASYHFALGLCYRSEGKHKDALKKYQDVLDLGGPKSLVALLKAEAHAADGKQDKVFECLKEAAIGGRNIINDVVTLPLLRNYQQDTEFIKLALHLEKFGVSAARTHDPFSNRFPGPDMRDQNRPDDGSSMIALTPEDQEKLLQEAKKAYERVQFYIKLEDEQKAMKAYSTLRDLMKKKDLLQIPKIVNDFRILVARLETLEIEIEGIRLKYYYNQAQSQLKKMKELFTDGEYARIEKVNGEVTKLTQEMEQTNPHYKPVAEQVKTAAGRWLKRAQVRQEFQNRKPAIQGIVISADKKMVVLNSKVVAQGEAVDDFRIVKVESNKVTFRYKGEEIPLVFRRY
jgi:tetratricopeptide (TPR) repeat protein